MDKPTPEHIAGLAAAGEPLRPHELAEHLPAVLAAVSSGASVAIADHDGLLAGLVPPVTVGALDALRDISDLHSLARVLGDFPEAFGALQSGLAASIGLVLQGLRRIEYYFRDGRLPLSAHPMSRVELREDGGIASIAFELDMAH